MPAGTVNVCWLSQAPLQVELGLDPASHAFPSKEALVNALFRTWKERIAQQVYAACPTQATPRAQFHAMWRDFARFALDHPEAFAFLEHHHHASYLDAESRGLDANLKHFGAMFVARAQAQGVLKPQAPMLLMELVFGAFNGIIRAHMEGRLILDAAAIDAAEAACWDAIKL